MCMAVDQARHHNPVATAVHLDIGPVRDHTIDLGVRPHPAYPAIDDHHRGVLKHTEFALSRPCARRLRPVAQGQELTYLCEYNDLGRNRVRSSSPVHLSLSVQA